MRARNLHSTYRRGLTLVRLGALATLSVVLSACGFTDSAGTNYRIVLESATYEEGETLASIGSLRVDEVANVRFEVTPADSSPIDRTSEAEFRLENVQSDDDASDFVLTLSTDLSTQPYHTLTSSVDEAKVTLCATYDGPETLDEPVETCMRIVVTELEEPED